MKYNEYKNLSYPKIGDEVLQFWKDQKIFKASVDTREGAPTFTFFEGPPSANGTPGIHHVMARAIKDIFCRYKTLQGFQVKRKAGWDTHGLPVELQVEKELGITKDDIGKTISVEEYNERCRQTVMKFTDQWNDLTEKMGYWVDLEDPYITYKSEYMESLWSLLKKLYDKGLLYKGYTIQPYSPAAGTGLSSHELNMPGTYKDVKDTTIVAMFKVKDAETWQVFSDLPSLDQLDIRILAWTTTPWTLPANSALTVGANISYVLVKTFNPYTYEPVAVVLAKDLIGKYFSEKGQDGDFDGFPASDKKLLPWSILNEFKGKDLEGIEYEQLMPYVQPTEAPAFRVIIGDFVTTEDGTGVVHTSPTFGADDFRVAQANGIPAIMVKDDTGKEVPIVDRRGRFVKEITDYAGRFVKPEYYSDEEQNDPEFRATDVLIAIKLKEEGKAFKVEKYEHPYPHCWRTDKPVLYYPMDSWFIKTTAMKDRLVELNKTINWKPESTGTGRFGNWLENLVDWNLSRSRYWGTPLPIWRNDHGDEVCVGSIEELKDLLEEAIISEHLTRDQARLNSDYLLKLEHGDFDLHRPYVDNIVLVSKKGNVMYREPDLIDVWFDSGAMPYAQWHYPFENQEIFNQSYPADFISEGVDQTRGWFFTLHAIAGMLFDSVAFKNVVSTGLVLDKNGNKMSKRLGNAVDPFSTLAQYGPDATRWYMITNAEPWDNLKFNIDGIGEVQRKFFGTLVNTYNFFALYANLDGYEFHEANSVPVEKRTELDRWILSKLNTLIKEVGEQFDDYNPTKAGRLVQDFVTDQLSNWYIRLNRRRFWNPSAEQGTGLTEDKQAAYETLQHCLVTVAQLMSPIAPFFGEWLYKNLTDIDREASIRNNTGLKYESVHLTYWPKIESGVVDADLEESMELAQTISSLVHSIRKKHKIKVRQPLLKVLIPVLNEKTKNQIKQVEDIILSEVNVKMVEPIIDNSGFIHKRAKPNFKLLGKKFGKDMQNVAEKIRLWDNTDIRDLEETGKIIVLLDFGNDPITPGEILLEEVEIYTENVPGWLIANENGLTVALDITIPTISDWKVSPVTS
jgi:isoleucyl-tRNA synthetase